MCVPLDVGGREREREKEREGGELILHQLGPGWMEECHGAACYSETVCSHNGEMAA